MPRVSEPLPPIESLRRTLRTRLRALRTAAALLAALGADPAVAQRPAPRALGPALAASLGSACPVGRREANGAFAECNEAGRVFRVTLSLAGWSAWGAAPRRLCSPAGLVAFAKGAWAPERIPAPAAPERWTQAVAIGAQEWTCAACPGCSRPTLAIVVSDSALRPTRPPENARWEAARRRVARAAHRHGGAAALLSSRDPEVRLAALEQAARIPHKELARLARDPVPAIRTAALLRGMERYDPRRVRWIARSLAHSDLRVVDTALHRVSADRRWVAFPGVLRALRRVAETHPDPSLAAQAQALLPP